MATKKIAFTHLGFGTPEIHEVPEEEFNRSITHCVLNGWAEWARYSWCSEEGTTEYTLLANYAETTEGGFTAGRSVISYWLVETRYYGGEN